jgi:excisionase family DNA binding protein
MTAPTAPNIESIHTCSDHAAHSVTMTAIVESPRITTPWLSVQDVSEYLRVPTKTVYRWRYRGEGPAVRGRAGRRPLYHRDDVDAWVIQGATR